MEKKPLWNTTNNFRYSAIRLMTGGCEDWDCTFEFSEG